MSTKDMNYCRKCPICGDVLPGTDDGLEVYISLKDQMAEIEAGETYTPNCTLCGEDLTLEKAKEILAKGEPVLNQLR